MDPHAPVVTPAPVYARKTTREDTPNYAIVDFYESVPDMKGPRFVVTLFRPFADGLENAACTLRLTKPGLELLRDALNDAHIHHTLKYAVRIPPKKNNQHTDAMPKVPPAPKIVAELNGIGTKRRRLPLKFSDFVNEIYQFVVGWHEEKDYHRCTVPGICAETVGRPNGRPRGKVRYALDTLETAGYLKRTSRVLPDTNAVVWGPGSKRP